mmetsp:Transcript_3299/g.7764  ORF Transcript_3299/g.7764 Transcript_3299/m.7764 type:complete len:415 (-) Transcript_3299:384-1628(-)|eukprot:CAMPEP_0178992162 /NCGR_PEP_ID=MMETSP0795-20121207/5950_1 /TAXON_ID=88552 /ORGANISM="Amoebophrya sp., Strain Ameob2" /LENGTH=414 /DNA_ID=CAMNT_0020683991 /DNA_START=72 /DNA_END=1316 /DNA_ORIENTATION=-
MPSVLSACLEKEKSGTKMLVEKEAKAFKDLVVPEPEQERALLSWEQALTSGLKKITRAQTNSTLSTHLKPPRSLFEPKLDRAKHGGIAGLLPTLDDSDVGPSASVIAYLTDRYRRERARSASSLTGAASRVSRALEDRDALKIVEPRSAGILKSPTSAVAYSVNASSAESSASLTSSQLRSAIDKITFGGIQGGTSGESSREDQIGRDLDLHLRKVELLEGPRRKKGAGSSCSSAAPLAAGAAVDLIGVAKNGAQAAGTKAHVEGAAPAPQARSPHRTASASPANKQDPGISSSPPGNLPSHAASGSRDIGARNKNVNFAEQKDTRPRCRNKSASALSLLSGTQLQSDAAVLAGKQRRKSSDLGFPRGRRPSVPRAPARCLKEEVRRDILIQDWMGLIQPRGGQGSADQRSNGY